MAAAFFFLSLSLTLFARWRTDHANLFASSSVNRPEWERERDRKKERVSTLFIQNRCVPRVFGLSGNIRKYSPDEYRVSPKLSDREAASAFSPYIHHFTTKNSLSLSLSLSLDLLFSVPWPFIRLPYIALKKKVTWKLEWPLCRFGFEGDLVACITLSNAMSHSVTVRVHTHTLVFYPVGSNMGFFNRDFSFSEILSALLRTVDESPHRGKERKEKKRKDVYQERKRL